MFERLQKPFLTVETGEAYQPVRLSYDLTQEVDLIETLDQLKCVEKKQTHSWSWYWREECDNLHFESLDSFQKNPQNPIRLGTLTIRDNRLFINLPSFKRACLAVPFFHRVLEHAVKIHNADFLNKVFGLDERLPHGFTELFKEEELEKIVRQRVEDYEKVLESCEHAETAEEAFNILSEFTKSEAKKRLPYAERYSFSANQTGSNPDIIFLGFYIFLRGRELVAIKRWFGETGYTLSDLADDTIEQVFGGMDVDIIE